MSHSNSSLNCFASCMAKYEHNYINHTSPCKPPSPHLTFGVMAHDCLYKAGKLRDENADRVVTKDEYHQVIPSEIINTDLKSVFGIPNWSEYFTPVIKQTAEYENKLINELLSTGSGNVSIEREIKLQLTSDELASLGYTNINQPVVGIIDCLLYTNTHAIILDYKFSSSRKSQDDFDMNSQLQLYAMLVHIKYDIPLHNIQIGYIDIPKQSFDKPTLLTNGTLSRSKSQNVSQDMYKAYVTAVHGDDPVYNCEPGGYYYDCWCNLALNKAAYLSIQYVDIDTYSGITDDLLKAAQMIDFMCEHHMHFCKKYDAYTCKSCEYINSCKPWLGVDL